jgi:L-alanine-DL-glutamate epimerase-like enolase superfamily enzyme
MIERVRAVAATIPTDAPESDGTLEWSSTTIVIVEAQGDGEVGLGWTYADAAGAAYVESKLAPAVEGCDPHDTHAAWLAMHRALRNDGGAGLAYMALSAVDVAIWDLKARLLGVSLARLIGRCRDAVPVYGSGGFTSYPVPRLCDQLAGWVAEGIPRVKMKVGRDPAADPARVRAARAAIGDAALFVDANGAYTRRQALELATRFDADAGVSWFEEPVSSEDLDGLRMLRDRVPVGMAIAAGEYGFGLGDFDRMTAVVDVQQADVTRCGGVTGLLRVDAVCAAAEVPLSGHCAPALHAHALCGCEQAIHLEYFHDHVRVEQMVFDGVVRPVAGEVRPDHDRPGLGIELKRVDAERWAA